MFKKHAIFIPDSVLLEVEWVLRYAYKFSASEICDAFLKLLGLDNVHLANPHSAALAIEWHEKGLEFADALHLAHSQQHNKLFTFDSRFIKRSDGLSDCSVEKP